MKITNGFAGPFVLLFCNLAFAAQNNAPAVDAAGGHQAEVAGIRIGMTAQDVLDRMGRMPDQRQDKDGEIIVTWRLPNKDIVQVHFRQDNYVSYAGLQFANPRPASDFWLKRQAESTDKEGSEFGTTVDKADTMTSSMGTGEQVRSLSSSKGTSELTANDPRIVREYKVTETVDHEHVVWTRPIKAEDGYTVDIGFMSPDKKKRGSEYENYVQFKYVMVEPSDLKKFDKIYQAKKGH